MPAELRSLLAQSFVVGLEEKRPTAAELELFSREGLGGAILFARNLEAHDPAQAWEFNTALARAAKEGGRPPLFIMLDQEGGSVARLKTPFTAWPDMARLAEAPPEALRAHGRRMGAELAAAGFNWDLAPVLDVHAMEDGIMAHRSLGSDPILVGELAAAYIQGMQGAGCLACAKHFPGLGRTTLDTHKDRPVVDLSRGDLDAVELPPYRLAIKAGVAGVMICHAVYSRIDPENPASLSSKVIKGVLRDELGYDGCVVSDDLEMGALLASMQPDEAAVRAYLAGCDILLICHHAEYALSALNRLEAMAQKGGLPMERIQATARRIEALKKKLPYGPPPLGKLKQILFYD